MIQRILKYLESKYMLIFFLLSGMALFSSTRKTPNFGLMGGYYARVEGLPDEVADAIRDHYKPVGQGDEVPTAPVTVAVSSK